MHERCQEEELTEFCTMRGRQHRSHLRARNGEKKKHSMESGEEYDVDEEKNDDLIVKAYLYIISSTYPEGCPGSRKRVI